MHNFCGLSHYLQDKTKDGQRSFIQRVLQVLLLLLLVPGLAQAQKPTLVQHALCPNSANEVAVPASNQAYKCPLPNVTSANDTIVLAITAGGDFNFTVTDDASDSFSQLKSAYDSTNTQVVAIQCASGISPGSAHVYVQPSSSANYMQVDVYEFQNASCALDGAPSGNTGTVSTSMTAGSMTTTSPGDLIFQTAYNDGNGNFSSVAVGTSPWVLEAVDLVGGLAGQYQVQAVAGAINPTFTQGTSSRYISAAVALKASSNGTSPRPFRILSLEHLNNPNVTSSTLTAQCPIHGNLMVLDWSSDGANKLNSVTDGTNAISQIGSNVLFPGNGGVVSRFYAKGVSANNNETLILKQSTGIGHGNTLFCYDITGAGTSPLDTGFGGASNGLAVGTGTQNTGSSGNVTMFTATPTNANEIIIVNGGQDWDTSLGVASVTGALFQSALYIGETEPTVFDENNFFATYYAPSTAAQTWAMIHNAQDSPGVGNWCASGSAFSGSTQTVVSPPTDLAVIIQ